MSGSSLIGIFRSAGTCSAGIAAAALLVSAGHVARGADSAGFWESALDGGASADARFDTLMRQAEEALGPDRSANRARADADPVLRRQRAGKAEPALRAALALRPGDLRATLALADVEGTLGRSDEGIRV
ncbi:MAG TPA: hypothetical protein VMU50_16510, partial [Polyangia bacterium]|nr:hypothetical protein [Polyangia bacterium]